MPLANFAAMDPTTARPALTCLRLSAFKTHLMGPLALKSHEEIRVHLQAAFGIGVDLGEPSAQADQ